MSQIAVSTTKETAKETGRRDMGTQGSLYASNNEIELKGNKEGGDFEILSCEGSIVVAVPALSLLFHLLFLVNLRSLCVVSAHAWSLPYHGLKLKKAPRKKPHCRQFRENSGKGYYTVNKLQKIESDTSCYWTCNMYMSSMHILHEFYKGFNTILFCRSI